jgi:carboxylesterase type B
VNGKDARAGAKAKACFGRKIIMSTNATTKRHRESARRLFNAFINAPSLDAPASTRTADVIRTAVGCDATHAPVPVRVAAPDRFANTRVRR